MRRSLREIQQNWDAASWGYDKFDEQLLDDIEWVKETFGIEDNGEFFYYIDELGLIVDEEEVA